MSLVGQVIDFYDDKHATQIKEAHGLEKFASTPLLSDEELRALPDNQFGLISITKQAHVIRKFPLNDAGHTWLANEYFARNYPKLSDVEKVAAASNIKYASQAYRIDPREEVLKYAMDDRVCCPVSEGKQPKWFRKYAEQELTKTASAEIDARIEMPDNCYALVIETESDVIRKYAMPDQNHVKIASAYFDKYAMQLAPAHRHQFANNVLRRARELDVPLAKTAHLEKWASPHYADTVDWHLEARKSLLPRSEEKREILDKLASVRRSTDPVTFATALHEFDHEAGLDRYYDRGLTDPWNATMSHEKTSSWHDEIDGDTLTEQDLRKAAASGKIKSHFGEAFANQFKKHAIDIYSSLPTPEKVIIKQIAKGQI